MSFFKMMRFVVYESFLHVVVYIIYIIFKYYNMLKYWHNTIVASVFSRYILHSRETVEKEGLRGREGGGVKGCFFSSSEEG